METRSFLDSAKREGRVLILMLLMAVSYLAGSLDNDCWSSLIKAFNHRAINYEEIN